jgi:hypothetical protein
VGGDQGDDGGDEEDGAPLTRAPRYCANSATKLTSGGQLVTARRLDGHDREPHVTVDCTNAPTRS